MNEWELLRRIGTEYQAVLGEKLTGIYVHGSIALGCFRWACSDIDFLVVVEAPLSQPEKEELIRTLLRLDEYAPPKGFEMSVLLRDACMPFADPTPYELHYSNAHRESYRQDLRGVCRSMQGYDADLAAHMTVVRHSGMALCGEPVTRVFAPVPAACYLRSIWCDVCCAAEEIGRDPVYHVLNLCRTLAFVQEGRVLSKQQGGEWAQAQLPEEAALIEAALRAYRQGDAAPCTETLPAFAGRMLQRIRQSRIFLAAGMEKD